jgi:hypothetical protein
LDQKQHNKDLVYIEKQFVFELQILVDNLIVGFVELMFVRIESFVKMFEREIDMLFGK